MSSSPRGPPPAAAAATASPTTAANRRQSVFGAAAAAAASGAPASETENVRVVCRVRPFNNREIELHEKSQEGKDVWDKGPIRSVVEFHGPQCVFLDEEKNFQEKERFVFDSCLWSIPDSVQTCEDNPFAGQEVLFEEYGRALLQQAWKGYNTCFFAYGQTGSGKTYSMMGSDGDGGGSNPGLIPRTCQQLFADVERFMAEADAHRENFVQSFRIEVRFLEIYNENVKDLLWNLSTLPAEAKARTNPENLRVRSSPATGVFVENLTAVEVDSWKRMWDLIALGNSCKHTAATKMNERSSRSHTIFKITVNQVTTSVPKKQFEKPNEHIRESVINLIDLAGSERNKKTGATGDRLKEASSINKSLHCLKFVIDVLVENATTKGQKKRPPYRDSTLTSLLMDSLGGNSKTFMLVCVSPHGDNADESLSTLRYGSRARQIVTTVHVNENVAGRMMVELEEELERMKGELDKSAKSASESDSVAVLKAQIADHEAHMQSLEAAINEQHQRVSQLKEQQEKELRRRYALAFCNLQAAQKCRGDRKQLVAEYCALKSKVTSLTDEKLGLENRQVQIEKEQDHLRLEIDTLQHKSAEAEIETDLWKKKIHRLEATKRELISNIEEQEADIKKTVAAKHAIILKARANTARQRVAFRRIGQEQQQRHEAEVSALRDRCEAERESFMQETNGKVADIEKAIAVSTAEHDALLAEVKRVETEKGAQIAALETELTLLKQENRRRTEQGNERLKVQAADWEAKYNQLVAEMTAKYEDVNALWAKKQADEIAAAEAHVALRRSELFGDVEAAREKWKRSIEETKEAGVNRIRLATEEWDRALQAKLTENRAMRERLRLVATKTQEYQELSRRIATVLQGAPKPEGQSGEYQQLYCLICDFQSEYEANAPSAFKLANLLRDDFEQTRCRAVPLVGVESSASLVSLADGQGAPTLERLRPRSPRRTH